MNLPSLLPFLPTSLAFSNPSFRPFVCFPFFLFFFFLPVLCWGWKIKSRLSGFTWAKSSLDMTKITAKNCLGEKGGWARLVVACPDAFYSLSLYANRQPSSVSINFHHVKHTLILCTYLLFGQRPRRGRWPMLSHRRNFLSFSFSVHPLWSSYSSLEPQISILRPKS